MLFLQPLSVAIDIVPFIGPFVGDLVQWGAAAIAFPLALMLRRGDASSLACSFCLFFALCASQLSTTRISPPSIAPPDLRPQLLHDIRRMDGSSPGLWCSTVPDFHRRGACRQLHPASPSVFLSLDLSWRVIQPAQRVFVTLHLRLSEALALCPARTGLATSITYLRTLKQRQRMGGGGVAYGYAPGFVPGYTSPAPGPSRPTSDGWFQIK